MSAQTINKHGLARYIDAATRRAIRQACGFGCVICGRFPYDYEHIDPEFNDAKEHHPDRMALLCKQHHGLVTGGLLSKEAVKEARANPYCRTAGSARMTANDFRKMDEFVVWIGSLAFYNPQSAIRMYGSDLLRIDPPEEEGAPFQITAFLYDYSNSLVLSIVKNEILTMVDSWDTELVGNKFTVRGGGIKRGLGDIALELRVVPRKGIVIDFVNMSYNGSVIYADANIVKVQNRECVINAQRTLFQDVECCVSVHEKGITLGADGPPLLPHPAFFARSARRGAMPPQDRPEGGRLILNSCVLNGPLSAGDNVQVEINDCLVIINKKND